MQLKTGFITLMILLIVVAVALSPNTQALEFDAGLDRGGCTDVKRKIKQDWFELKSFFRPDAEDLKRPKSSEFFCVAPVYTRGAIHKSAISKELKCYTVRRQNFCCDSRLQACAGV